MYTQSPYSAHPGRDRFNNNDGIFEDSLIMTLRPDGDGYLGIMSVNVAAG